MRRWSEVFREALLILCAGTALGLVSNSVRPDGIDLLTVPARATEGECAPPAEQTQWISLSEATELAGQPDVLFVDARPTDEFVKAHVAGAYSVPFRAGGSVPREALEVVAGARVVITYCDTHGGCSCSVALAREIAAAGGLDVRVLEGGWPAWEQAGAAAEAGTCRLCLEP
jgi:rhodanese-related sulfurtransferase